ncbi:phage replisome organizer N-terminal domain-containing protein [Clostridium sp. UBA1652]|uniref:phage replisome organizer N-terminal domain-containing protein n=1 Tax=Clostridium sp. UBA1652 TaxID=1946348 RepID=UPI00257E9D94|nr:phage replisome organizer N-terminal domain-containing protein [Clostridium sp. UBA1652]
MADNRKYYYLKLKDNFFDSEEIKILESLPNGIYYSNLLIKLYLKSLKYDGALRFNDFIPYDENMIATITNLNIDTVKSGLNILNSMKLIERLDDGTMYMMNIQSFIGKSSSEADRKRLYRERIEEEKTLIGQGKRENSGQMSQKSPKDVSETNGTFLDKHSLERAR